METERSAFFSNFAKAGFEPEELVEEFGQSARQIRRYLAGECKVPKLVAERMRELARARAPEPMTNPAFRFIDLFAGIGGMRLGFEAIGGRCVFTSEWDRWAQKTYLRNDAADSGHGRLLSP